MANRYWVGGTASWDATAGTKWALTSGGAGGQAVPTASDDVFFSSLSTGTVTITVAANCQNLDCTGFAGTLIQNSAGTLNISATGGKFLLSAGMTYTPAATSNVIFLSTTDNGGAGWPITLNTKSFSNVTFNGSGGKWVPQDAFKAVSCTVSQGQFNANGQSVTCTGSSGFGGGGLATASVVLGSSTLTTTNFTYTGSGTISTSGTIICTTSFSSNLTTFNNISYTSNAAAGVLGTISGNFTCVNLTIDFATGSDIAAAALLGTGGTPTAPTITGTFTVNGTPGRRILVGSAAPFTTNHTITAANVSLSYTVFMDVTGAGAATWSGTELGDGGGNSGITFLPSQTNYWVGGAGTWSDSSHWASTSGGTGGTGRVPLAHDDIVFDALSGSGTVSLDNWCIGRNLNMRDSSVSITAVSIVAGNGSPFYSLLGSIELPTGAAVFNSGGSTNSLFFMGRSPVTVTSHGKYLALTSNVTLGVTNGTVPVRMVLASDLALGGTFTMKTGSSFDNSGNYNVTADGSFGGTAGSASNKNNWGNGVYKITSNTASFTATSTTTVASSPTIRYTGAGSGSINFSAPIFPNILVEHGTMSCSLSAANPIKGLTIYGGATFKLGTSTVVVDTLSCPGTSLTTPVIASTVNTTARTLTVNTSASVYYTSIRDNTAAGAAAPLTAYNSTNVSNNTNWIFVTTSFAPAGSFFEVL